MNRSIDKLWTYLIIFLAVGILCGGIVLTLKQVKSQPIEITITPPQPQQYQGQVHIDGAVTSPGFYSWNEEDTLQAFLQGAGLQPEADLDHLKLYVPEIGEVHPPQKIDLNRAEAWLLEALPEIGPAKAQTIINYRTHNGPFLRIEDLLKVEDIGQNTYDRIKALITVGD